MSEIIINRLKEELTQAETFISQNINIEYWQGVKHGVELALDGFRAVGISTDTTSIKIHSVSVSETGTTDLHLINGTSVPFASPESALRWVLQKKSN